MYYVKCWLDARRTMLAYVGAVAFCVIVWIVPRGDHATVPTRQDDAAIVLAWSYVCAWLLAVACGATGPGADIGEGFGPFLLTRPRSRAYFAWVAWLAGLSEIVVLLSVTVGMMTVASVIRSGVAWYHVALDVNLKRMLVAAVITTLVTYGITYLLTTIFRSGKRAIIGTIAITAAYTMAGEWITLPSPTLRPGNAPLLAAGWLLLALACPLAAQAILSRAEV